MRIIKLRNSTLNTNNHTIGRRSKLATGRQITNTDSLNIWLTTIEEIGINLWVNTQGFIITTNKNWCTRVNYRLNTKMSQTWLAKSGSLLFWISLYFYKAVAERKAEIFKEESAAVSLPLKPTRTSPVEDVQVSIVTGKHKNHEKVLGQH